MTESNVSRLLVLRINLLLRCVSLSFHSIVMQSTTRVQQSRTFSITIPKKWSATHVGSSWNNIPGKQRQPRWKEKFSSKGDVFFISEWKYFFNSKIVYFNILFARSVRHHNLRCVATGTVVHCFNSKTSKMHYTISTEQTGVVLCNNSNLRVALYPAQSGHLRQRQSVSPIALRHYYYYGMVWNQGRQKQFPPNSTLRFVINEVL